MTRALIARDALGTLTKLGQGGQGIVYPAPRATTKFASKMVYKEYKPQARAGVNFGALAAMPTLVEDTMSDREGHELVSIAAWPCALVENGTGPAGFVMPAIPDPFFIDLTTVKGVSRTAAEFQHLLNPHSVLAARGITITDTQRYELLREVAKALSFLHRIGVCVGDISPKNLLFSLRPRPAVYFIDCDTMRVNGVSVLPQVETPEWQVPAGEELATIQSDTYKLGLLALRLLTGEQHTKNPEQLPHTTPKPLRQLITDTLTNKPHRRPLPEAWTEMLGHVIEETQGRAPSAQTATAPKPAPTHKPEPQPVVRSRPTTTPGKNRMAATVSTSPTPANTQPATQSIPKRAQPLIGVAAAGFLVFVIVIFVIIALANSSSHGSSQSSRDVGSSPSTQIPTTAPTPVTTSATTPPPTPTTAPAPPTSGVSYKGLTCSSQEALWLSTAQSVVLICDQGGGTYVYNGLRLSDGASIQIPGAFRTAEGFSVTNKGWRYDVGLDGLVLQSPDGDVDRQPAVESGY